MSMTPKQRMLAAYRGELPDYVPVAPEFWYYVPAKLLGKDMITFEREVPHWQALQQTFKHYGTEGWGGTGVHVPVPDVTGKSDWVDLGEGRFEARHTTQTPYGSLTSRQQFDREEPSWSVERQIKVFERDWPAYKHLTMGGVIEEANWPAAQRTWEAVGEDYLLEMWLASPFFDYIAGGREGGLEQGIFDLIEHEAFFEALHEEYLDYVQRLTRAACRNTTFESLCIGCAWSCVSLIGPAIWRRWDKPVIQAVAKVAHEEGRLLHIHFHGKCLDVLDDLAECGADCICPFERPPGGDVTDLSVVRKALGDRVTMNGNVHTVETLIRGTADDVRREVEEIFAQWGPDPRRLILGTGDQVGGDTPEENIYAMIETGRRLGKCP
ncbi:MAG: uroporphyrinogen decarboxylase family protein [Armatimonadota bacterium]